MAKNQINYSDLTPKELELLKDTYIHLRVKGMNNNDLRDFAIENIGLQIKSTIGNDEELEAWQEMEKFFKDEFENTIQDIKIKMSSKTVDYNKLTCEVEKLNNENKNEDKKLDMW